MLSDIFKKLIEITAKDIIKGIDEITKTMEEASKTMEQRNQSTGMQQSSPPQQTGTAQETKLAAGAQQTGNSTNQTDSSKQTGTAAGAKQSNAAQKSAPPKKPTTIEKVKAKVTEMIPDSDEGIRLGLTKFKMDMMRAYPFYGDIMLKIPLIEDKNIPTACTNGRNIRYNPNFFRDLSEGERNYIYLHEVMHIMLLHWKRCGYRDPEIWNVAADWVINSRLDSFKYRMPNYIKFNKPLQGCFLDIRYRQDYTEKLYDIMINQKIKSTKDGCIFIDKRKYDNPIKDLDAPDKLSEEESESTSKMVKAMVQDAMKRRGGEESLYLPREIMQLVATKKLPWRKLLYDFLQEKEDDESSYFTPERKYIHMDLIVPGIGKKDDDLGEIWAFIDSSGSIGGDELSQFMTQLYRVAKEFECTFNIAFWDTEVTDVYKGITKKEDILKCMANHSGGTNINCVYDYLRDNHIKPEVMIILTDGYFGTLLNPDKKLKEKTILVLSKDSADIPDNNDIGRLAKL